MGKREADNQLTQDNWENEDGGGEGGSGEFKKADERAMAGRKIRGLPKRKGAGGGAAPAPPAAAEAAPKASPFAFGAPAAASPNPFAALNSAPAPAASSGSAFSFGAPAAKPATNGAAAAPSFSFGATSSFSAPPPASTSSSSSSTAAAPSSAFSFGSSSLSAAPKASAPTPSAASGQSAAHKYYTALRALNVSLLDSLTSEIDKDPFLDLSAGVFDKLKSKYAEHRSKVQKEFDQAEGKPTSDASTPMAVDKPATAPAFEIPEIFRNPPKAVPIADLTPKESEDDGIPAIFKNPPKPVPIADLSEKKDDGIPDIFKNPPKAVPIADLTEKKEDKAAPPAPPAMFSFAGSTVKAAPAPAATSTPPAGGFVFKADAPADPYAEKSKFTFPAPSASSTTSSSGSSTSKTDDRSTLKPPSAPKLAPAKLTNPPAKPSPLRFGQSVSPPTSPEKAAGGETEGKKEDVTAKKPAAFNFGAAFGSVAKGEKKKVEEKKAEEPKKDEAAKPAFGGFGSGSSTGAFSFTPSTSTPSSNPFSVPASSTASSSTSAKSLFGAAPTPFSTPATSSLTSKPAAASPPIASSFGAGSPPTFGFGAALQGKDKDKALGATSGAARNTGFGFGSSIGGTSPSAAPAFGGSSGFSFGSSIATGAGEKKDDAAADKNQPAKLTTGFSFGSSTAPAAASTSSAPTPAPAFSFSSAPASSIPPAAASRTASVAPSDASEPTDSAPQTPGGNPFAAPGEGEEGETVLHAVRGKVWRIEGGEQELLGIANVQLKEKEEGGKNKVRMLARNETNGAVLINFSLHSSFTLKCEKVFATFTGFDSSAKPVIYRLRVKTKEMVDEFEQEVEKAKGKLA